MDVRRIVLGGIIYGFFKMNKKNSTEALLREEERSVNWRKKDLFHETKKVVVSFETNI